MALSSIWPWALGAVLILALFILILLALLLRRSAKSSEFVDAEEPDADEPPEVKPFTEDRITDIPDAFRRAATLIDRSAEGDRKDVPLFLLVGESGSRDTDLLANTGLDLPWGAPSEAGTALGEGQGFWLFDRGVVLDVAGNDFLGADRNDDSAWKTILTHLQRLRPKRPVDGVIVTLSAAELLNAATSDVKRTELTTRAGRIYRRLWEAQQELGFRLPTYVLVTGCEKVAGFRSLCGSLRDQSRRQIVGWSNPNGIESVFRATWIDDAIEALVRRLDDVTLEVFTEGTMEGDQLLRLSPGLASLSSSLKATLEGLFKASAYQGTLIFRGLYFCGREQAGATEDAPPAGPVAFLAEVLGAKVFIEHRLASPTARTVLARNRSVTIAKTATAAAFLLALLSLGWAAYKFHRQNTILAPLLSSAAEAMEESQGRAMPNADLGRSAIGLLNGMAAIDFDHYDSAVVPVSWFAPFQAHLEDALTDAFHDIILRAIRADLKQKSRSLVPLDEGRIVPLQPSATTQPQPPQPPATPASLALTTMTSDTGGDPLGLTATPPAGPMTTVDPMNADDSAAWADARVTAVASTPEFLQMRGFVAALKELDEHIAIFNHLRDTGDLRLVGRLVKYSFGLDLPQRFYSQSRLYRVALQKADYKRIEVDPAFRDTAAHKLNHYADDLHEALFRRNAFAARLQKLSSSIQTVTWQPPTSGDTQPLQEIAAQLRRIDSDLSGPELEWAFRSEFDLGPDYNAMLADVAAISYFGKPVAMQLRDAASARWGRFQQGLTWASSPLTKTILSIHDDRPEMHLSKESLLLQSALQTFLGQTFMASPRQGRPPRSDMPEGVRLTWNATALEQAVAVAQAYERFRSGTLSLFPVDGRVSVDQVARERALADMLDLLNRAQVYEVVGPAPSATILEEQIRSDLARFNADMPALETVFDACSRLSPEAGRIVASATSSEASRLLRSVDRLIALDRPYATAEDVSRWDGGTPPSPRLWGAEDELALGSYLEATRGRVAFVAMTYAKPLLTWLNKSQFANRQDTRDLVEGWQAIIDDLRDHEAKRPANAVAVLEDYIGVRMTRVSASDCTAATLPTIRGNSFFARTAQQLSRDVRQRCLELAGRDATSRYASVERYFNQRLAGRYPFADALPGRSDQEADPADIRAFFRLFDANKAVIAAAPAQGGLDTTLEAPRKFIADMTAVRAFFATFLDAPKAEVAPSLDVEATFRVLKPKEIEGEQIIGWSLGVGEETITNRQTTKKLRWTWEEPLQIALRWAADAPRVPVAAGQTHAAIVDHRTVVWKYENRWSLLAALADHPTRSDELPSYADVQPVTLAFDLASRPLAGPETATAPTRVFMRIAVLAPGTNQPLEIPRFPARAPRITTVDSVKEVGR